MDLVKLQEKVVHMMINVPLHNESLSEVTKKLKSSIRICRKELDIDGRDHHNITDCFINYCINGLWEFEGISISSVARDISKMILENLMKYDPNVIVKHVASFRTAFGMVKRFTVQSEKFHPITFQIIYKDSNEDIQIGKRISILTYLLLCARYLKEKQWEEEDTFLLFLGANISFTNASFAHLSRTLTKNPHIDAVCGRILPNRENRSYNPFVCIQDFFYWLKKSAELIFGSVGCYSLYRAKVIFSGFTKVYGRSPFDELAETVDNSEKFLSLEMGEDRLMACLLQNTGTLMTYCPQATAESHCPPSSEFFKQQRRWFLSGLITHYNFGH